MMKHLHNNVDKKSTDDFIHFVDKSEQENPILEYTSEKQLNKSFWKGKIFSIFCKLSRCSSKLL
jgi:hypothetical protein